MSQFISLSRLAVASLVAAAVSGAAQAALIDRGGGLIYDSDLNVTWLADANYAQTSDYDADGLMTWNEATAWVTGLAYYDSVRGVTYSDWRLPSTTDLGSPACNFAYVGTNCGYNIKYKGEMAHLFYDELGNVAIYDETGHSRFGWNLSNIGPFKNLQEYGYWSGTEYWISSDPPLPISSWVFTFDAGGQYLNEKTNGLFALAVRDGDVTPVPEPSSWTMMLVGIALLVRLSRKFNGERLQISP